MKKVCSIGWMEWKKTVETPIFFGMILALAGLCMFIPVMNTDGQQSSCLQMFLTGDGMQAGMEILRQILSGYFIMFAPLLVGIALLPVLCESRESGMNRYVIHRSGIWELAAGRYLAAIAGGAVLVSLGFIVFSGIIGLHSLLLSREAAALWKPAAIQVAQSLLGTCLFGAVSAMWICLVSIFVRNRYLLVSIPYIAMWFVERKTGAVQEANIWVFMFGNGYLLHPLDIGKDVGIVLLFYAALSVFVVVLMAETRKRGVDRGI